MNQLTETNILMTSLDIAELTGKKHQHVMRDIRNEIESLGEEIGQTIFGQSSYINSQNKEQPCYKFGKDGAMQLALKYDALTRYKVIKHIEELEREKKLPVNSTIALLETALKHEMELAEIKTDVDYLKENMRIDGSQQHTLFEKGKRKVLEVLGGSESPAYNAVSKKVFAQLWGDFKRHFHLPRYSELPKAKFDDAVYFISKWRPSTSLEIEIESYNRQGQLI